MERLPSGLASTRWPGPGCWPPISGSRAGRHLAAGAARPGVRGPGTCRTPALDAKRCGNGPRAGPDQQGKRAI